MKAKIWTLTAANTNERVAAVIMDAFNSALALDPRHTGAAPRDVMAHLRFAMTTDAGRFI